MSSPTQTPKTTAELLETRKHRGMLLSRMASLDAEINEGLSPDDLKTALYEKGEIRKALALVDGK